jgi:hypothetical protein
MSRWFVKRLRKVKVGTCDKGGLLSVDEGFVGIKRSAWSAMDVQPQIRRNSETSVGKFLG